VFLQREQKRLPQRVKQVVKWTLTIRSRCFVIV
jgi:hypothetical protein